MLSLVPWWLLLDFSAACNARGEMEVCCGARRGTAGQCILLSAIRPVAKIVKDISETCDSLSVEQLSMLFLWYKLKLHFVALTCSKARQRGLSAQISHVVKPQN